MGGGGYESDLNLNNIHFVGDFPIEHSLGGFGIANNPQPNKYTVTLNPPVTNYRPGLPLYIIFIGSNSGSATLNVNNQGDILLKKISGEIALNDSSLINLNAGDLIPGRVYILVFDGQYFQVTNLDAPVLIAFPIATEFSRGLIEIATQAETNEGIDNQRAITPQKLAQYVADKVTGLWDDKGLLDCSANPNYPAAQKGDAYTANVAGKIGGPAGTEVQIRDVIYCTGNNAGGTEAAVGASWNVIQGNLVQATTALAGIAKIASQAEVTAGTDDTKFITPLKLITYLNSRTKMRSQIRFQSDSLPESQVTAAGSADYHFGIIAVTGIPAGATIRQASLSWEGYIRNLTDIPNSFDSGNLSMQKDGGAFANYLNVINKIQLGSNQVTFFRFVEDDVKNVTTGSGTYLAKFSNLSSLNESLAIAGHWTLEIDYES